MHNLAKHLKYEKVYKPNELYWGLGIEHETYLETSEYTLVNFKEIAKHRKRERYSVDYYSSYKMDALNRVLNDLSDITIAVPTLINSHSLIHCDTRGEHKTTYSYASNPNPRFSGKTLHTYLCENDTYYKNQYDNVFLFDGDTIEFMSLDFYCTTVSNVIAELYAHERRFLRHINYIFKRDGIYMEYLPLTIQRHNYHFAQYITNPTNYSMFNNGTLHINITLPTLLDENAQIKDITTFRAQHCTFIRILQWLEPLWIALYGSIDPFSEVDPLHFCAGSQRLAVSRYIGVGTYDTDTMESGKILTKRRADIVGAEWYNELYATTGYAAPEYIGLDINFQKHFAHGVELRIFDAMSQTKLHTVLEDVVYAADFSLIFKGDFFDPRKDKLWKKLVLGCMRFGADYIVDAAIVRRYSCIFCSWLGEGDMPIGELYLAIMDHLRVRCANGECVKTML